MLQNKNAIIYGAGGSLGGAIAKALAKAGATIFLTGRNLAPLQIVADEIIADGGKAETAIVDAMDEQAVNDHLNQVLEKVGSVDISYNAIDLQVIQGMPLIEMAMADFVRPVSIAMQTHFITATAAAKAMVKQGSGVILSLTATPAGIGYPNTAGFAPACAAIENFMRNLAAEIGIYGVRAVNMRSGGSPDSKVFKDAVDSQPGVMAGVLRSMENDTMLKRLPLMEDIANTAVFLASPMAAGITGVTVDVSCGTTAGLNYRVELTS